MKESLIVTKSGYSGDDIRKVNPVNSSVKPRSATEQPVYENFVVDNKELLSEEERESIVNNDNKDRINQSPQEVFEYMNSNYNRIKEDLLEQNKSRK